MQSSLAERISRIFTDCGITCYFVDGNKKMKELGIDVDDEEQVIEFDMIGFYETTGFIIEDTTQSDKNIAKIKLFQHKCSYFNDAFDDGNIKFQKFDTIPSSAIKKLNQVTSWKYIYIGTGKELIQNKISEKQIPQRKNLYVLNSEHLAYLDYLIKRIGSYTKHELLERLEIDVGNTDIESKITTIQLENKRILGNVKANLFLFQLSAEDLLTVTRVPRYGSLKPWMPEFGSEDYQRLLNENKINKLSSIINKSKELTSFPNALTVVLSDDISVSNPKIKSEKCLRKLSIPHKYGVMAIIDGQHRLFGFAKSKLTKIQKQKSKLAVIGIQFQGSTKSKNQKLAAKTFVDINREQTKVPTELTYWLGYSVLGELDPKYLATRILILLETTTGSNLKELFHTRPFQKINRIGTNPIKIVTVANELSKLVDSDRSLLSENKKLRKVFKKESWLALEKKKNAKPIIAEGYKKINEFFGMIKATFPNDWDSPKSLLFSSKYITAFLRLYIEYKKRGYSKKVIMTKLAKMNSKITTYLKSHGEKSTKLKSTPVVFWNEYENIPALRDHVSSVIQFVSKMGGINLKQ